MLAKRILTAAIGIPVAIYVVSYGALPFYFAISILALAGILEMTSMFRRVGISASPIISAVIVLLMLAVAQYGNGDETGLLISILVMGSLSMLVLQRDKFTVHDAALTILNTLYVGWLFTFLILLRNISSGFIATPLGQIPAGAAYTWLALVATWTNDTGAYFIGTALGKHKLCPQISPGKTVEGALGGLACSVLATAALGTVFHITLLHGILLGLMAGCLAPIGDLVESSLKRFTGVKDSGRIFPGHGGVLDRFDSILFVVPAVYFYLKFFILD